MTMHSARVCQFAVIAVVACCAVLAADDDASVTPAKPDSRGVLVHEVASPYQKGATRIRVLLPKQAEADVKFAVVYLLPVEAMDGRRWGDAFDEVLAHKLHTQFNVIFVAPTFSHLPWYADHPSDKEIRQETYFLKVVVPFIERTYPAQADKSGRLLAGFSKSGWGAFSLLLRHGDTFAKAAAWDAPLMMDAPGRYGSGPIFGTPENFEKYEITQLLKQQSDSLGKEPRLAVLGYGNFRRQHQQFHDAMSKLSLAHVYHDGPSRKHSWNSGWLADAVEFLCNDASTE